MNAIKCSSVRFRQITVQRFAVIFGATVLLLGTLAPVMAQTTIVSTVPSTGATGISSNQSVVITFSAPMNTNKTTVTFYTSTSIYTMSNVWNATSNVLTCSPVSSYMVPAQVVWAVSGVDATGNRLQGTKVGDFFTSDTVGSGSGTNAFTTFLIGRADLYTQAVNGQPTPYLVEPYIYLATTTLASNRTTTGISLTLPTGGVSNLVQDIAAPEKWVFGGYMTNEATLETNFPPGDYTFTVNATSSNEAKVVSFPASLVQPNPPQLINLVAAQSIDSTQPFSLQWDPFVGGTATDYIAVGLTTNWQSPNLPGTATLVTIPAGTMTPGKTYTASVAFSHTVLSTNGAEATYVYRSAITQFVLTTKPATVTTPPVVTNPGWSSGVFGFDLLISSGQTVTVVSTTNSASPLASWTILLTTNSPGTQIHISDPNSRTSPALFYRVRNGN